MGLSVLVTGNLGFIGRHVVARLLDEGHSLVGVDSLEPRVHQSKPMVPPGVEQYYGHIGECRYAGYGDVEVVVHLAAQVGVGDSSKDPLRYVVENTLETVEFLRALEHYPNLKRIVVASSMSVYGEGGIRVREDAPCVPQSVYGQTKYDQERLVRIWGQQHGVEAIALRFFNVYGPGQQLKNPYTGVLANFANWLLNDQAPVIYGDGSQMRDWVYVDDVAECVCRAATWEGAASGTYNVCTGANTTLLDATRILMQALGKTIQPNITHQERPGDILHCTGNPSFALAELGWRARTPLPVGLLKYAGWLKENR
jgi:dTDP-L-rhamnose 4-epimerase